MIVQTRKTRPRPDIGVAEHTRTLGAMFREGFGNGFSF